ncbi:outer membrane lipoprotein-sorting protein [Candidatus Cloacimonadota bacterium]
MKHIFSIIITMLAITCFADFPDGNELLKKVDKNLYSDNVISTYRMIISGRRAQKVMKIKNWTRGEVNSFSEYLSPPKDAGTKMLKLDDKLWIYDPGSDRTVQISGHMLRQSVMGSDLSYEDFLEEHELTKMYNAEVVAEEIIFERDCWVLDLNAKMDDIAYYSRKIWIDKERYLPLKEERFAKSGKLLKRSEIRDVFFQEERWYPKHIFYKDMLSKGKGTELFIDKIEFVDEIPDSRFTKAALRN